MKINIGANIKKLRNEKQVTQEQLADHLLISCQAVSKWENNVSTPDISLIPVIAEYFDVLIDELFKVNMAGYKNKASRLAVRYDMSGKKEDFEKADAEYEKLLTSDKADKTDISGYARLNVWRADALVKKAEDLLKQAISLGEEGSENLLITLLAKQGRSNESIAKYEALIDSDPGNVKNWHKLIHAYYPIGRDYFAPTNIEKAHEVAQNALEKFPNDALLHCLCGFIYKGKGECEKALKYWGKSMQLDPGIVDNYHAIAWTCQKLERYTEAVSTWEKLIAYYEQENLIEHITRPEREIAKLKRIMESTL